MGFQMLSHSVTQWFDEGAAAAWPGPGTRTLSTSQLSEGAGLATPGRPGRARIRRGRGLGPGPRARPGTGLVTQ